MSIAIAAVRRRRAYDEGAAVTEGAGVTEGRERVRRVVDRLGLGAGSGSDAMGTEVMGTFVDRVEAALDGMVGMPAITPYAVATDRRAGAPSSMPATDDGAWVWRAAEDVAGASARTPLAGWRLGVKDLVDVAGHPVRAGSAVRGDAPSAERDAPVVVALRRAGALVVGATKLHEFAFGVTGLNDIDGTPRNPAAPGRVPGGSSSGSAAAVAAGEADVALGTDTGGSCRIPAACCGVVGFKPSYGSVPTTGVIPLSPSLDHVGWLTPSVERAVRVAETLGLIPSGAITSGAVTAGAGGVRRVGVHRRGLGGGADGSPADAAVVEVFDRVLFALGRAGVELVDVAWPTGDEAFPASTAIMFSEAAFVHRDGLANTPLSYGADVRTRLVQGCAFGLETYLRARGVQTEMRARCLAVLAEVDAVVVPTLPVLPPLVSDATDPAVAARLVTNTRLANLTGLPAASVPVPGLPLPVGVQVEAATDLMALRVAALVESVLER